MKVSAIGKDLFFLIKWFPYLGFLISDDRRVNAGANGRMANASKPFGAMLQEFPLAY